MTGTKKNVQAKPSIASVWAVTGVLLFLMNGVRRVLPIALQPFSEGGLGTFGWMAYVITGAFFVYAEGYRGFQKRLSPLVVRRALLLNADQPALRQVLAPAYAMAFFHAGRGRKAKSFLLLIGIAIAVALVKKMPYPYRSILDGGVCAGLTWGMGSIACIFARSVLTGLAPNVDPCLPEP